MLPSYQIAVTVNDDTATGSVLLQGFGNSLTSSFSNAIRILVILP